MATLIFDTAYYGSPARYAANEAWATITAGAGTTVLNGISAGFSCDSTTDKFDSNRRAIIVFDTSEFSTGVLSADITLTGTLVSGYAATPGAALGLYTATPADPENIAASDYANCGSDACSDTTISAGSWDDEGLNVLPLNAKGLSEINSGGYTVFCLREANYDVGASTPPWEQDKRFIFEVEATVSAHLWITDALPVVTTETPSWSQTKATLKGSYTSEDDATVTYAFQYGLTDEYGYATDWYTKTGTSGTFYKALTGFAPSTTYHFRAAVTNEYGTSYGEDMEFTTGASDTSASEAGYIWIEGADFHWIDANGAEQIATPKSLFNAQTVLAATSDNTPAALTVTEQTLVGRLTGANISAVGIGIADNSILQVDDALAADNDYAKFTAAGIEGVPYATVLSDIGAASSSSLTTHAGLDTGVHGAGTDTLATDADITTHAAVTASVHNFDASGNAPPQAHKDNHDPNDGSDPLDTANAAEISVVVAAGTGTSHSLARADHVHAISHAITDNHIVTVDSADAATGEYAKFTASGLESKSVAEVKTDLSLSNVENLKVKLDATEAPDGDNDVDEGYAVGSRWFDVTNDKEYVCLDASDGAAVWTETTVSSGAGDVATDAIWDAKGDIAGGTGANTAAKLTVGADGTVLTAASGETTGLKWAAPVSATKARAYPGGSAQTISDWTDTQVVLDTESYDTGGDFNVGTYTFTVPTTGYYLVTASIEYASPIADKRYGAYIKVNAAYVNIAQRHASSTNALACGVTDVLSLTAADTVQLWTKHSAGGSETISASPALTYLAIVRIA